MGVHISRNLKEELAWAIDNWLQVISDVMSVTSLRNYVKKDVLGLNNIVCVTTVCGPL